MRAYRLELDRKDVGAWDVLTANIPTTLNWGGGAVKFAFGDIWFAWVFYSKSRICLTFETCPSCILLFLLGLCTRRVVTYWKRKSVLASTDSRLTD